MKDSGTKLILCDISYGTHETRLSQRKERITDKDEFQKTREFFFEAFEQSCLDKIVINTEGSIERSLKQLEGFVL